MLKISWVLFFFLFTFPSLFAQILTQRDSIDFAGMIVNSQTGEAMPGVSCRNGINSGTVSNDNGLFRIRSNRRDSIRFTHIGFKAFTVVIPDSLIDSEYIIGIFMSPDTILLSEALIIRRWKQNERQNMINARNNMSGLMKHVYAQGRAMDADMNQRMMLQEYARSVEMKGHVDVKLGVGTHTLDALGAKKMRERLEGRKEWVTPMEVDLLKKIYYSEKRRK